MIVRLHLGSNGRPWRAWAANLFLAVGAVCLAIWGWGVGEGALYQHFQSQQFTEEVSAPPQASAEAAPDAPPQELAGRAEPAQAAPPAFFNFSRPDPQLIGRLDSPEINLSVMIREGIDDDTLRRAVGHLPASAMPGEQGNFILLGHRDTFFRALRKIERGATLRVRTRKRQFTYVVDSIEVTTPESVALRAGPQPSAILITCYPFNYIGPAPRRFVVHARLEQRE